MKGRVLVALAVLGVLVGPAAASADTVRLSDFSTTGYFGTNAAGGGGPFLATTTGSLLGNTSFMTYCLEFNEHFTYGGTYNFTLSDGAVNGGVAGGNPDLVSDATKWLYFEALTGGYSTWYATATGAALTSSVGASFQTAIWWLEQERTTAEVGGITSSGYRMAQYALANENWDALSAQGHRVYAMNLTTASGALVQDQLAYARVPEPGTLLLLGTALVGLAGAVKARRQRR